MIGSSWWVGSSFLIGAANSLHPPPPGEGEVRSERRLALPHAALVHRRPRIAFHALAQCRDQRVVGHEVSIVVGDLVRGEWLEALRRRYVGARRERADLGVLLLGQDPGEVKLRPARMRRVLEDA